MYIAILAVPLVAAVIGLAAFLLLTRDDSTGKVVGMTAEAALASPDLHMTKDVWNSLTGPVALLCVT